MRNKEDSDALPTLPCGLKWWVIESTYSYTQTSGGYGIFHAVVGVNEDAAVQHLEADNAACEAELIGAAVKKGEIADKFEWKPKSQLIRHVRVTEVQTHRQIEAIDQLLIDMLLEHDFFLDDFRDDVETAVGGSFYEIAS